MMFQNILIISLTTSLIIILLLLLSPIINKRYSAKWRYYVWLVLAIRLAIPIRIDIPTAPLSFNVQDTVIYPRYDAMLQSGNIQTEHLPNTVDKDKSANTTENPSPKSQTSNKTSKSSKVLTLFELLKLVWGITAILYFMYHILVYAVTKLRLKPNLKKIEENIYECDKISTPVMLGFFKPTIVLPDKEYTIEERELIIRHEKAHFKRKDTWFKLLLLAVNALHWFNPIIYIMVSYANRDIEYACDSDVIKNRDTEFKKKYSLTILKSMEK